MKNLEEYVDERAYDYFRWGYTGKQGNQYSWDSQCSAKKTLMINEYYPVCAYCGRRGLPLQPHIAQGDYLTYGHTCVCKDAMDSLEVANKIQEILDDAHELAKEMRRTQMPKVNPDVVRKVLQEKTDRLLKDLSRNEGRGAHTLEEAGIKLIDPQVELYD